MSANQVVIAESRLLRERLERQTEALEAVEGVVYGYYRRILDAQQAEIVRLRKRVAELERQADDG